MSEPEDPANKQPSDQTQLQAPDSRASRTPPLGEMSPQKLSEQLTDRVCASDQSNTAVQQTSAVFDLSGMTPEELKWERDIFRDVLNNVNNTLRFQIQLAVPLLAGCITVLNIIPPQAHQEMLNDLDRWVFLPVIASMILGYKALEFHWYSSKRAKRLDHDIQELYKLVSYKHKMLKYSILLQGLALVLLMVFVLLEYK